MSYASFMSDMADYLRRKKEDIGQRQSLFQGVSPGNVGNVFDIPPSNPQFANTYSTNAYGMPVRVLEIVGDDALGEMVCVSLQHERLLDDANNVTVGLDTVQGPLVGQVEFGAGAGLSAFEFDITSPVITPGFIEVTSPFGPTNPAPDTTISWQDRLLPFRRLNGIMLSLPASSMRVFVRNDANAPYLHQGGGLPPNHSSLPAISLNTFKDPAKVRVHATYGRRPFPHTLTRTLPICFAMRPEGGAGPTAVFPISGTGGTGGAESTITIMIPAYAKKVFFPRFPLTPLSIKFFQSSLRFGSGSSFSGNYTIPIGDEGPLEIHPLDTFIKITNIGPLDVQNFSLVFELGI